LNEIYFFMQHRGERKDDILPHFLVFPPRKDSFLSRRATCTTACRIVSHFQRFSLADNSRQESESQSKIENRIGIHSLPHFLFRSTTMTSLKRLAATAAVTAVLFADPCCGWMLRHSSEPLNRVRTRLERDSVVHAARLVRPSIHQGHLNMAASVADGSSNSYGWRHRVLRKIFRREKTELEKESGAGLLNDNAAVGSFQRNHVLQKLSLTLEIPSHGSELDPFSVPTMKMNIPLLVQPPVGAGGEVRRLVTPEATTASDAYDTATTFSSSDTALDSLPSLVLSKEATLLSPADEATLADSVAEIAAIANDGGSPFVRFTRPLVQSTLIGLFGRWSQGSHENLDVICHPRSKTLDLVLGRFACDATVDFDRIIFPPIRMHKGRLEVNRMTLGVWSLTPGAIPIRGQRYLNQFDFYARNITFTGEDLIESRCIRNGLRNLLRRILKLRGTKAVQMSIKTMKILPNNKISCHGEATTKFGKILEFEVRCGLDFTSRGHIMTFPGLEISLNPRLGLFVPVLPTISLDLGNNAQLLDLDIDGQSSQMKVSARVTIAPHHTLKLQKYTQSQHAYRAQYSFDVGRWLTRLGNFTS
jgi:hypothetical protein